MTASSMGKGLLAGRRVLVTGAARGIGAAVAQAFAAHGAAVAGAGRTAGAGIAACDVTDERAVAALFDRLAGEGPLHDVVHAAGVAAIGSVEDTIPEAFRQVIEVNLVGAYIVAREAARRLERGGNLVFIASQAGLKGGALWSAYSASKGGLLRLADCLTEELGERGIRVNSISPGTVDTEMLAAAVADIAARSGRTAEDVRERYRQAIPLRRFADPDEIAGAAVALCSGLLSYANGSNIVLDGGELSR